MILAATTNFVLNLETIGIFLGILVSISILLGLLVQFSNKINRLESNIQYLKQELIEHEALDGHKPTIDRVIVCMDNTRKVEEALNLHIQDYINRKDYVQFVLGQLDQKVGHKYNRISMVISNIQKFLERDGIYRIRDPLIDKEEE